MKIIYIIGSGRSGSTLLERVLNSNPDVCGVGELHAMWRLPWQTLRCSCGDFLPDCSFWTDVLETGGLDDNRMAKLKELEWSVVRNKFLIRNRFDLERVSQDPGAQEFLSIQNDLFSAISKVSGCSTIVDSSKSGPRGWVLSAGLDIVHLHSYRNARDVIASWRKPKFQPATGKPMLKPSVPYAAMDWWRAEQSARMLKKKHTVCRLNYKTFAKAPKETLKKVLDPVAPGLVDEVAWLSDNSVKRDGAYHSLNGNPDRFSNDDIVIRPKRVGNEDLPVLDSVLVSVVGGGLNLFYR